jgi:hypothetical protein
MAGFRKAGNTLKGNSAGKGRSVQADVFVSVVRHQRPFRRRVPLTMFLIVASALGWSSEAIPTLVEQNERSGKCISKLCSITPRPVGTIRISVGVSTVFADVEKVVSVLGEQFVDSGAISTRKTRPTDDNRKDFCFPSRRSAGI